MNGFAENRASGTPNKAGRAEAPFDLATAGRMLPLVRRIIDDLVSARRLLAELVPERERLDRQRRTLAWPERARRYQVHEEVADHEQHLQDALAELEVLGLALLDAEEGRVGFPAVINNRPAYFSWRPGQETLRYWQFAGDSMLRTIPADWFETTERKVSKAR